jgi:hypothetical protein
MATDEPTKIEGEPDPKPFKIDRVTQAGEFVSRVAEYATEGEMRAHKRRGDWHYKMHTRRGEIK